LLSRLGEKVDEIIANTSTPSITLCLNWLKCLEGKSMEALLQNVEGIAKAVTLMVIHLCFPEVRSECRVVSDIPLTGFRSLSMIREYVNNIIDYGVSSEVRGRIFIMGNTGTGKSSLAGTLKFFSDMPDEPPRRFLTGDPENNHLKKTKGELNINFIFL
jgi:hypothetical protein